MSKLRHEERLARWAQQAKAGQPPVPAATVILVRDGEDGCLETLLLRRNSKLAFVGGMWVFPGGRLDPEDWEGVAPDDELGAARRGAAREALEESGLVIPAESMAAFSHWTPPPITPKRFLTWFFIAQATAGTVRIDHGEIHDHAWMRPGDALARRDAGEIELAPPTFVTLHELAETATAQAALDAVRARTPEHFTTRISVTDEGPVALWHGDAGYVASDASLAGPRHRLCMGENPWRYERGA